MERQAVQKVFDIVSGLYVLLNLLQGASDGTLRFLTGV